MGNRCQTGRFSRPSRADRSGLDQDPSNCADSRAAVLADTARTSAGRPPRASAHTTQVESSEDDPTTTDRTSSRPLSSPPFPSVLPAIAAEADSRVHPAVRRSTAADSRRGDRLTRAFHARTPALEATGRACSAYFRMSARIRSATRAALADLADAATVSGD